jgi:hypothetical protein
MAQGAEFRVNTFTTGDQLNVAVAMDADGDFVVAWESSGQDGSLGGIYAQRYSASGVPQDSEFRVNSFTTGGQRIPATAMDADGDFVVTWYDYSQDGSGFGIYAQRYNAAGTAQGGEFRVNSFTIGQQRLPSVAMDDDGDIVVAWQSAYQDGSGYGVYAQRYNAAGIAQGVEFRVNSYTTSSQGDPSVAIESDGDFVVAWIGNQDGGSNVYAQRYNAEGVAQGAEFRVNSLTIGSRQFPAVGMDADGDFVITWTDGTFAFNGQDGSLGGIFAQRYAVVPTVTASSFIFATAPHRLQFAFDEDVSDSLGTDDLLVENLTTGQTIPAGAFVVTYEAPHNRATFSHIGSGGGDALLPDGNYRATLRAAGIHTPNGNTLPADHVLEFRFLTGDANNDGAVNLQDFNILAANFGQSPRDFTQGDFNYDGTVNLIDFNILAGRFGAQLAPLASRAGASPRRALDWPLVRDDLEDLLS